MTQRNRCNASGKALFIGDLADVAREHLPELAAHAAPQHMSRSRPRENLWRTIKARPEVIEVLDTLAGRHAQATGRKISKSEIIAAALSLSLPVLATRVFTERKE